LVWVAAILVGITTYYGFDLINHSHPVITDPHGKTVTETTPEPEPVVEEEAPVEEIERNPDGSVKEPNILELMK
jgi:hypothetical protein